ncbi:hypothetical protein [Acinetobacter ursingii]|uniref:hypothetical protein n=1 Tax=Acinetobacter ursingii TaxID=108980 RepID=UPI00124F89D5|nr:hypothetical protein [Acinetobacter ursingii]MCU4483649.1 hypothetical protein [Acinetobacter ursingii]MCU4507969.1 hypothetical protein [Acinetobacter ursingii]
MNPEQLFELFYQDITADMNPPGMRHRSEAVRYWWRERFMNAQQGIEEPRSIRSWAEAPQMWLKGYQRGIQS